MLAFFFFTIFMIITTATTSLTDSTNHETGWISTTTTRSSSSELSSCEGSTVGECENGHEFGMDSEISRRILETTKYISYESLKKNSVPCSQKGASYYNCKPGAQANPYNRGCSAITKCRS
ncbi:hypothetical protein MKW92_006497 [Papaver armeniacum]|nr:hypothetical protein MKW92_006497 [Papaver armeniacum]